MVMQVAQGIAFYKVGCKESHWSGSRQVYQGHALIQMTASVVEHLQNPSDQILNTAQMRDAFHVQKHRVNSTQLDSDMVLQAAATKAIDAWKLASTASVLADKGSHGHGRGHSSGSGSGHTRGVAQTQVLSSRGRGRGQVQTQSIFQLR